ncbi:hypothetical protein Fmac_027030 [Flemingia macrophylla]|uniref:DUF4228 domain protein n=1 Tax=Flemingia macrophylla TaxID=520843 RepID=A0ABD1LGN4_9FABA
MGNCLKHQSSSKYSISDDDDNDGDHWNFKTSKNVLATTMAKTTTEVKIKITKKQLEELLSKVDVRELRVEEVLSQLMNHSGGYQSLQRPWRPALQSIPESMIRGRPRHEHEQVKELYSITKIKGLEADENNHHL